MPILHNVRQRSEEWDRLRLGIPTSSCFHKILTPGGKASDQWQKYACHLIAERLLGRRLETYVSPSMERGADLEMDAVRWYELDQDLDTNEIGFVTTDDHKVGCSPDRLVGDDGLLEIKIPEPHTQVWYWLTRSIEQKYTPQLQGQLWVAERDWNDVLAWHEELPRTVIRVGRNEQYIKRLAEEVGKFNDYISGVLAKIDSLDAQPRPSLREALDATLGAAQ